MPPLPRLTARELLQKLRRLGFIDVRQNGSHLLIRHFSNPQRYAIIRYIVAEQYLRAP